MWTYVGVTLFYLFQIAPIFIMLFGWASLTYYQEIAVGVYAFSLVPFVVICEGLKRGVKKHER